MVFCSAQTHPAAGVERRQKNVLPGSRQYCAQGSGGHPHVGLGRGRSGTVTNLEAPEHSDQPAFCRQLRVLLQGAGQIGNRPGRNDCDPFAGILHEVDQRRDAIGMDPPRIMRQVVACQPRRLVLDVLRHGPLLFSEADGNVAASRRFQELRGHGGTVPRVPCFGQHQLEVQFRRPQKHGQGPRVINVGADVGRENDREPDGGLGGSRRRDARRQEGGEH